MIEKIGERTFDELIVSGRTALHTHAITLAAGAAVLNRGQLIGKSEAGAFGAVDGTYNKPYGILTEDVDLSKTTAAVVYVSGNFNAAAVIGYEATHYDALREKGIFVEASV